MKNKLNCKICKYLLRIWTMMQNIPTLAPPLYWPEECILLYSLCIFPLMQPSYLHMNIFFRKLRFSSLFSQFWVGQSFWSREERGKERGARNCEDFSPLSFPPPPHDRREFVKYQNISQNLKCGGQLRDGCCRSSHRTGGNAGNIHLRHAGCGREQVKPGPN